MAEGTTRVEAFSDGVFAIAITLLILEIKVPHAEAGHSLWEGLKALWPSYVAFLMSFFVILIMWVNHHELMRMVREISYPFFFANGLVLLTVTFVPFPTAVLAEHLGSDSAREAVTFYCATFIVNSLTWVLLLRSMLRGNLLREDVRQETIARVKSAYTWGPLVYLISTAIAFVQPVIGLLVNVSLWLLWVRLCYRTAEV